MSGTGWKPSYIESDLYDIVENHEIGFDVYDSDIINEISHYFSRKSNVQWQLDCTEWPDMTGGVCYISFIDDNTLHMVNFEYKY